MVLVLFTIKLMYFEFLKNIIFFLIYNLHYKSTVYGPKSEKRKRGEKIIRERRRGDLEGELWEGGNS